MKKLNKTQVARMATLGTELQETYDAYDTAVTELNEKLQEFKNFRDEVVSEMDEYLSERSEKWHEGDAASQYQDWKSTWEQLDLEEIEKHEFDIDFQEMLPTEPGYC